MYAILTADTETQRQWEAAWNADLTNVMAKLSTERDPEYRKQLKQQASHIESDLRCLRRSMA